MELACLMSLADGVIPQTWTTSRLTTGSTTLFGLLSRITLGAHLLLSTPIGGSSLSPTRRTPSPPLSRERQTRPPFRSLPLLQSRTRPAPRAVGRLGSMPIRTGPPCTSRSATRTLPSTSGSRTGRFAVPRGSPTALPSSAPTCRSECGRLSGAPGEVGEIDTPPARTSPPMATRAGLLTWPSSSCECSGACAVEGVDAPGCSTSRASLAPAVMRSLLSTTRRATSLS